MKTCVHFNNISRNSSQNKMIQTKVVEGIKTHTLCSVFFFLKILPLWDNVEKYCRAGQATDDNITRCMHSACRISKATNTHSQQVILLAFLLQQFLHERASTLRYTYTACLISSRLVSSRLVSSRLTVFVTKTFSFYGKLPDKFSAWYKLM
jgi:hypothetical protein